MSLYQKLFIDGQWVESQGSQRFSLINPATEQVCADVVMGTTEDVDKAVQAARRAFKSWRLTSSEERARYIEKLADALHDRRDDLAQTISDSMGIPKHLAYDCQVDEPINILRTYASRTSLMDEVEVIGNAQVFRKAIGVCALISPWNYPLNQLIGKMAPALAAGCTMILKPAEQTSLQDFIVAECIDAAGIPAGVVNLVPGYGPEVGAAMSAHPDVDLVSFTGSTRAGALIAQAAAPTVKRVVQELGGKSPLIMAPDCDLNAAIECGLDDVLINTGQTCTAYTRWFVPAEKLAAVEQQILNTIGDYKIGTDESAYIGPLVNAAQYEKVLSYIQLGQEEGARLLTGGTEKPAGFNQGYFVQPTVFSDVRNDMRIAQEEIFGPVICLIPYTTLDDAIEMANNTVYGLASSVFAKDATEGMAIAKQLDAGLTYINGGAYNIEAPFGGMKQSGNGREFGDHGLHEYTELQAIHL